MILGLLMVRDSSKEQPGAEILKPPLKLSTAQTTIPTIGTDLVRFAKLKYRSNFMLSSNR